LINESQFGGEGAAEAGGLPDLQGNFVQRHACTS
jgi:hypothetical protein